ncbi:hypothetical protein EBZ80_23010 [bacterium]|jgi:hypothetical protein|nr:hypothetical protein [bacterium]
MELVGSRQRLIVALVLLAALACLICAFPVYAVQLALNLSIFLPALAAAFACAYGSRHPKAVFLASICGLGIGWWLTPVLQIYWGEPPTWWDWYLVDLKGLCPLMLSGAVSLGLIGLIVSRMVASPNQSLDQTADRIQRSGEPMVRR